MKSHTLKNLKRKKEYYVGYYDKYGTMKHEFIKARNEQHAEKIFYKKHYYGIVVKISLV